MQNLLPILLDIIWGEESITEQDIDLRLPQVGALYKMNGETINLYPRLRILTTNIEYV
jgi:hypothetical protein